MTINSENRKDGPFTCNGLTVAFPFTFKVFDGDDVLVVLLDSTNVETDLISTADYSVTLNADQDISPGGTVTTVLTYATGNFITLSSRVPFVQPTKLTNSGGFYPSVINDALDRSTIQIQQINEKMDRCVQMPLSGLGSLDHDAVIFGVGPDGNPALRLLTDLSLDTLVTTPYSVAFLASINAAAARGTLGLGSSATVDVGTSANKVVQLDASAKLPAVDGSLLINMQMSKPYTGLSIDSVFITTIRVRFTGLVVSDLSGRPVNLSSATFYDINPLTMGANGLDTGALVNGSWYAVFVIYNQSSNTIAALLSASTTAPTLPIGYTYYKRVGMVKCLNAGAGQFYGCRQYGNIARYFVGSGSPAALPQVSSGVQGNPATPTFVDVSTTAWIPTTAISRNLLAFNGSGAIALAHSASQGAAGSSSNPPDIGTTSTTPTNFIADFDVGSILKWAAAHASAGLFVRGWVDDI
jgi:hypothetical protein